MGLFEKFDLLGYVKWRKIQRYILIWHCGWREFRQCYESVLKSVAGWGETRFIEIHSESRILMSVEVLEHSERVEEILEWSWVLEWMYTTAHCLFFALILSTVVYFSPKACME